VWPGDTSTWPVESLQISGAGTYVTRIINTNVTAGASNAVTQVSTNGTAAGSGVTNLNFVPGQGTAPRVTSVANQAVGIAIDAVGPFDIATNFDLVSAQEVVDGGIELYGVNRGLWPGTKGALLTNGVFNLWFWGNGWVWDSDFESIVTNLLMYKRFAGFGSIFYMAAPQTITFNSYGDNCVDFPGMDTNWLSTYAVMTNVNMITTAWPGGLGGLTTLPGSIQNNGDDVFFADALRVCYIANPTGACFNVEIRTNGSAPTTFLDIDSSWIVVTNLSATNAGGFVGRCFQWTNLLYPGAAAMPTQVRVRATTAGYLPIVDFGQWNTLACTNGGVVLGMFAHDSGPNFYLLTNQQAKLNPIWSADAATCVIYSGGDGDANTPVTPTMLPFLKAGYPGADIIDMATHEIGTGAGNNLPSWAESAWCFGNGYPFFRGADASAAAWGNVFNAEANGLISAAEFPHLAPLGYGSFGQMAAAWLGWATAYPAAQGAGALSGLALTNNDTRNVTIQGSLTAAGVTATASGDIIAGYQINAVQGLQIGNTKSANLLNTDSSGNVNPVAIYYPLVLGGSGFSLFDGSVTNVGLAADAAGGGGEELKERAVHGRIDRGRRVQVGARVPGGAERGQRERGAGGPGEPQAGDDEQDVDCAKEGASPAGD